MTDWTRIRHFTEVELACRCGTCPGSTHPPMDMELMLRLDALRDQYGHPIRVTSGYRCPIYNAAIGSASDSSHLGGQAVDIRWRGAWALLALAGDRFQRLEIAPHHLHLEHRPERPARVWVGRSR